MHAGANYNTIGERFWAGVIDGIVLAPLAIGNWLVLVPGNPNWLILSWAALYFLARPIYSILMHARYGQTLGKMHMQVVVLDVTEDRLPTLLQAFLRDFPYVLAQVVLLFHFCYVVVTSGYVKSINEQNLGMLGDVLAWSGLIWFLLEIGTMLLNKKHRALHDWIADTVVLQESADTVRVTEGLG